MKNMFKIKDYSKKNFFKYKEQLFVSVYHRIQEDTNFSNFLNKYGEDNFFLMLNYHLNVLSAVLSLENYKIIYNHQVYTYNVLFSRGVDYKFFLNFYKVILEESKKLVELSLYKDLKQIYSHLNIEHEEIIELSRNKTKEYKNKEINEKLYDLVINGEYEKSLEYSSTYMQNLEDFIYFFDNTLVPILHKVGFQWEINNITFSKEHLATAVIENIIDFYSPNSLINSFESKKIVVIPLKNENHNLSSKIISKIGKSLGYDVVILSNNTLVDLEKCIQILEPDFIALSVVLEGNLIEFDNLVNFVNGIRKENSKIIAGGPSLNYFNNPAQKFNIDYFCNNFGELLEIL